MIKVLYVLNDTFRRGGTEAVVLNYFRNIDHNRIQIDFMLHTSLEEAEYNDICKEILASGSKIFCVTPRKLGIKKNKQDIENVLKNNNYDIIHTHTDCIGAYILRIAKKENIAVRIAHSHSTNIPIQIKGIKSLLHYVFLEYCRYDIRRQANHYMACTKEAAVWLFGKANVNTNRVTILNNAIDIDLFKRNIEIRDKIRSELGLKDKFVVGHVGRFVASKNHEFLINVFNEVYKNCQEARLLLVGTGELESKIREQVHSLQLDNVVIFYGTTAKPNELFQAMDVFVFPSKWEGLGVVLIEAQAAGLPCIVTDDAKVSKKSAITDLVTYIPIDNICKWSNVILKTREKKYEEKSSMIRKAGYDIHEESDKLMMYYETWMKGK